MCMLSMVMQEYTPPLTKEWRPSTKEWLPPEIGTKETPREPTFIPLSGTINLTPQQMQELLESFHKAVSAAKEFDRLTGQPDCVDPEKAKLEDRVAELEEKLEEIGLVVNRDD